MELVSERHGFPSKDKQRQEFLSYFEKQTNKRKGNTKTAWINTLNHLRAYSRDRVLFTDIDRDWLDGFVDYLKERVSHQSVSTYFSKISCSLNEAVKDKILPYNPAKLVDPIRVPQSPREYLTIEEIKRIAQTPFHYEEIQKAFLFSCFTGLRYGDIATLRWSQIKETNFNGNGKSFAIHKRQGKTGVLNHIPLNETALSIIGGRPPSDALVFSLKFHKSYIRKQLTKLLVAAAINKQITFHCARHTYAVMLLVNGANLMTVKELMGHKDIKSTQIYAKVVDASKDEAVAQLP